jgi:predicted nuclease of predicted toxin-antitoxin system
VKFLIDSSLGGRKLKEFLQAVFKEHSFASFTDVGLSLDCPDEEWLAFASKNGYVVLTADKRIADRPLQRSLFTNASTTIVIFNQAKIEESLKMVERNLQLLFREPPQKGCYRAYKQGSMRKILPK